MNLEDLYRLLRATHVQAQGIVDTVREPLLLLDHELRVVAAGRSYFEAFRVGRDETLGRHLYELGDGQWDIPDLRLLLEAVVPRSVAVEGYEVEHDFPGLGRRTMLLHARRLAHPDNNAATLLLAIEDVTARHRAERERELRLGELRHRMGNLLAVVQALARLTRAEGPRAEAYRDALLGRLAALSRAHGLALAAGADGRVDLAALVGDVLGPYTGVPEGGGEAAAEVAAGPPVALATGQAQALALVLHELAANAAKHGALSTSEGRVRVGWGVEAAPAGGGRLLRLRWEERGGPRVAPPAARGFGVSFVEGTARHELDGRAELTFAPEGLAAEIDVPLPG